MCSGIEHDGFLNGYIAVATVLTSSTAITTITDDRTWSISHYYTPASFTSIQNAGGVVTPAPLEAIQGTISSPISNAVPAMFIESVGSNAGSITDPSSSPGALKVYAAGNGGGSSNVFAGQFISDVRTAQTRVSTGAIGVYGQASLNCPGCTGTTSANSAAAFAGWFVAWDNGQNAFGTSAAEIDTHWSQASRAYASRVGLTIGNGFSSNNATNDWGIQLSGYGYGIALDNSNAGAALSSVRHLWVRNTGSATVDNNTTILAFESGQLGMYNYGLDFRNAAPSGKTTGFFNTGGCCAIIENSGDLNQLGKIGVVGHNLAGVCTFSSSTSCTSTFTDAYSVVPICVVTQQGTPSIFYGVGPTTTQITIHASASNSNAVNWICIADPN